MKEKNDNPGRPSKERLDEAEVELIRNMIEGKFASLADFYDHAFKQAKMLTEFPPQYQPVDVETVKAAYKNAFAQKRSLPKIYRKVLEVLLSFTPDTLSSRATPVQSASTKQARQSAKDGNRYAHAADCFPFVSVTDNPRFFRPDKTSPKDIPLPTKAEFVAGDVPRLPIWKAVVSSLKKKGFAVVSGTEATGKTTLAVDVALSQPKLWQGYYLNLAETGVRDLHDLNLRFLSTAFERTPLLIIDNAQLDEALAERLLESLIISYGEKSVYLLVLKLGSPPARMTDAMSDLDRAMAGANFTVCSNGSFWREFIEFYIHRFLTHHYPATAVEQTCLYGDQQLLCSAFDLTAYLKSFFSSFEEPFANNPNIANGQWNYQLDIFIYARREETREYLSGRYFLPLEEGERSRFMKLLSLCDLKLDQPHDLFGPKSFIVATRMGWVQWSEGEFKFKNPALAALLHRACIDSEHELAFYKELLNKYPITASKVVSKLLSGPKRDAYQIMADILENKSQLKAIARQGLGELQFFVGQVIEHGVFSKAYIDETLQEVISELGPFMLQGGAVHLFNFLIFSKNSFPQTSVKLMTILADPEKALIVTGGLSGSDVLNLQRLQKFAKNHSLAHLVDALEPLRQRAIRKSILLASEKQTVNPVRSAWVNGVYVYNPEEDRDESWSKRNDPTGMLARYDDYD